MSKAEIISRLMEEERVTKPGSSGFKDGMFWKVLYTQIANEYIRLPQRAELEEEQLVPRLRKFEKGSRKDELVIFFEVIPGRDYKEIPLEERLLNTTIINIAELFLKLHKLGLIHVDNGAHNMRFTDPDSGLPPVMWVDVENIEINQHPDSKMILDFCQNVMMFILNFDLENALEDLYVEKELQLLIPDQYEEFEQLYKQAENRREGKAVIRKFCPSVFADIMKDLGITIHPELMALMTKSFTDTESVTIHDLEKVLAALAKETNVN